MPVPSTAYQHAIGGCLESAIGAHGLPPAVVTQTLARLVAPLAALQSDAATGRLPLLTLPTETADIVAAEQALARLTAPLTSPTVSGPTVSGPTVSGPTVSGPAVSGPCETLVFFGTGGSGLGGQTLAQFAGWNIPGVGHARRDPSAPKRPRTRFYDNLDADTLAGALASLDLATTRFVVTSKSGGTVETLVQAIAALTAVRTAGLTAYIPDLFLGITEPAKPASAQSGAGNGLRTLFSAHGIPMLDHHTGIGGRFCVFTNVGLLPALARGLDVRALRRGARDVVAAMRAARQPLECQPALGAAVAIALAEARGVSTQVIMPYADRLGRLADWFVQLWAESLGKHGKGTTPLACLGPRDQHSQLQLFMDGPRDHLLTFIRVAPSKSTPPLDTALATQAGIAFMGGRTVGDLVAAQAQAVPEALMRAGRPVRTFDLPLLDEAALGALLMHFMLETLFAAALLGIDAFDQPAVELAKTLTRDRLR